MKVLIAGLGLIGGSFALALRDHGIAEEILGVESSEEHAAEALQLGLAFRKPISWCWPPPSTPSR